jgi:hypothetical protein
MIGRGAAGGFGGLDLADQRMTLLFEYAGSVFEAGALASGLLDARVQGLDLRGRAVVAAAPGLPLGGDRCQPARSYLGFTCQRLGFCPYLGEPRTLGFDVALDAGEPGLDIERRRQCGERPLGVVARSDRLVAVRGQPCLRLAQRREPRGVARHLTFGLGKSIACRVSIVLKRAPAGPRRGLRLGGGCNFGLGCRHHGLFRVNLAAQGVELGFDIGEPVLAGETACGAGRRIGQRQRTRPSATSLLRAKPDVGRA